MDADIIEGELQAGRRGDTTSGDATIAAHRDTETDFGAIGRR